MGFVNYAFKRVSYINRTIGISLILNRIDNFFCKKTLVKIFLVVFFTKIDCRNNLHKYIVQKLRSGKLGNNVFAD